MDSGGSLWGVVAVIHVAITTIIFSYRRERGRISGEDMFFSVLFWGVFGCAVWPLVWLFVIPFWIGRAHARRRSKS